ncbi:MFS transporter [Aurantiacibacter sediminis]|uniref:MFS transporter n=1 Tax=Aurantiacibacter sediminis TaxID=2793064 RepID=A0ABS0MZL8_9SPHN|nr:MFS transporter [Aurantiacibacter sediminis]MBH5321156.1 MFS transporter [Aurantiacibacter sediminis]
MAIAFAPPCDETAGREGSGTCPSQTGTLIATVLGSSLAFVMGAIINVALPQMQADFGTDAAGVQWIVNSYLLPLSALVLVAGALGDRFGRKRLFLLGLALYSAATLACIVSPTLEILLGARVVQGVGAAILAPNSLAILADAFTGKARGKAIGTWAAAGAIAGAAAPLAGGVLVDWLNWRWAFAVVLPLALGAAVIGWRAIGESREEEGERPPLDFIGAGLVTLGLGGTVYGLTALPDGGFSAGAVGPLAVGLIALAAFFWNENRLGQDAMMPMGVFGSASFSAISILTLLLYAALGALLVLLPFMLINAFDYGATAAGAAMLPFPLIMGALSRQIGGLSSKVGMRLMLTAGPLLVAAGFALMAISVGPDMSYWTGILPGLIVMALGMAASVAPLTTAVMNAVEQRFTGVASGINNAISRTAGLIATALLGFVLTGGSANPSLLVSGFATTAWVCAALAIVSAATVFFFAKDEELTQ